MEITRIGLMIILNHQSLSRHTSNLALSGYTGRFIAGRFSKNLLYEYVLGRHRQDRRRRGSVSRLTVVLMAAAHLVLADMTQEYLQGFFMLGRLSCKRPSPRRSIVDRAGERGQRRRPAVDGIGLPATEEQEGMGAECCVYTFWVVEGVRAKC
jgi:hypothetical protein